MYCDFPEFGRCCFCLPLRRGVLTFGYINILFSAFVIGVYSYWINSEHFFVIYHGVVITSTELPELCIAAYCLEIIFNCVLLYGTHRKILIYLKIFYYYAITTTATTVLLQIIEFFATRYTLAVVESLTLTFAGLVLQLYLIILVRSLLKKLTLSDSHTYENQLHQIVTGESKVEANGIYNQNTVIAINEDA